MKNKKIIIIVLCILAVISAGCINSQNTEIDDNEDTDYFIPAYFDRGVIESPPDVTSYSNHALEWSFDIENSTGFADVSIRDDYSNRIPVYVAKPGTDGRIAIKMTANEQDISVFLNSITPISDGMSLYLENEPININKGETVNAYLILKVEPYTENTATHTFVELNTVDGWVRSRVCQLYSDNDENRPDFKRIKQN